MTKIKQILKKPTAKILIVIFSLIFLWVIVRVAGWVQFYNIPNNSNAPNIVRGDYVFATNIISYKKHDFICYDQADRRFAPGIWMSRVCGMPGDEIEIIDGVLFVNGENFDEEISLMHDYFVSRELARQNSWMIIEDFIDSVIVTVKDDAIKPFMDARRVINNKNELIYPQFDSTWSMDNFGPITVPENKIFILGDNRHKSVGSRILGFIDKDQVGGVIVF